MGEVIALTSGDQSYRLGEENSSVETRAQWLLPAVEAVTAIMCSAAPLEFKIKAACASLVDHAMASGVWLMTSNRDRMSILAAESEDEELHPITSNTGLNELLLRRLRNAGLQSEKTYDPVIIRGFDALGLSRDFVAAPLLISGRVIGILACLFKTDMRRSEAELQAVEIIARIMAVALQNGAVKAVSSTPVSPVSIVQAPGNEAFQENITRQEQKTILASDAARLEAIIGCLPGSVIIFNEHGVAIESVNGSPMVETLPLRKAGNQGWLFNFSTDNALNTQHSAIRKALRGEKSMAQFQVGDWSGSRETDLVIEQTFSPVRNDKGSIVEVVGYAQNVTERVSMSESLRQMREHDSVTDCLTMSALREQAEREIFDFGNHQHPMVFFTIEVEKFGTGIHLLGQSPFEELLHTVVARIRRQLPRLHALARRGDHSFVAFARLGDDMDIATISANKIINVLCEPIVTGRHEYFIATNVGYSIFPKDGGTLDEMFYNSDIAAMEAARERPNFAMEFAAEMANKANERVRIETALHRAVDHEEFDLAYQPKVDLETGEVTGVEALIRWPGRKNISPEKFIPIAEECGLISFIGEWVLRHACKTAASWASRGYSIPISVNVSTRQFQDQEFNGIVEEILNETGCDPELLELEVTEGVMIRDPKTAMASFRDLKKIGVKLSIDDFGMGFSSLSYLKTLSVDKLKIDRTFVAGLPNDPENEAITKAILAMAKAMGLRTVAEGVEDLECLKHLRMLGCDEIQGYYFSKPLFENDFISWLEAYESVRNFNLADVPGAKHIEIN